MSDLGNFGFGGRGKVGGKMEWVDCSRGIWRREVVVFLNELGEEDWVLLRRVECWVF